MMARLGDVGVVIIGNTPKTSDIKNYESQDICFVKPSDIDEEELTLLHDSECHISEYARKSARMIPVGSVLVTCIGIIGKVGINYVECAFNQQINAIIPDTKVADNRYLAYTIKFHKKLLQNIANAPVVPILNKSQFSNLEIFLPPLDRQREIAAVLDKISELSAKRKSQLDKLDELIKARFVEMFGDPVINQKSWPVQKLSTIADYFIGLTYKPSDVAEDGIIVLRSSNIQHNRIVLDDVVRVNTKIRPSLLVKKNDILMCSRNGSSKLVGKVARIAELQEEMTLGAFMTIIRSEYYDYLFVYFQMEAFRMQMSASKTSTINQITKKMLDNVQLPLPPLGLQQQFSSFASCVEKQKSTINRSLAKLETLKKSLMQEYFG